MELNILLKEIVEKEGDDESLAVSGDHSFMEAPIYNSLGYLHYWIGEKEKSKEYFEKYRTKKVQNVGRAMFAYATSRSVESGSFVIVKD